VRLDLASVLLQWAAGGLAFTWVTTRHRVVGLGYGWLCRLSFAALGAGGVVAGIVNDDAGTGAAVRDAAGALMVACALLACTVSMVRRDAGVSGLEEDRERKRARVAAMLGDDAGSSPVLATQRREFDPRLDLLAPLAGIVSLLGAAEAVGGPYALSASRLLVGAAFLGAITDAMLLGHWYLVQPGLSRQPIRELVKWSAITWPVEVVLLLVPTGMVSVLNGSIDDGYRGLLGWMWVVAALTTIVLLAMTWKALDERAYSAVMAATGLLYLAILTAFGTDVLARALLAP
jgi:hypothetical protein